MEIIETLVEGKKNDPALCEDMIFISCDFIAVVDGVTSKSKNNSEALSGGRLAAQKVYEAVSQFPQDIDAFTAVSKTALGYPRRMRAAEASFAV